MSKTPLAYSTNDVIEHYGIPRKSGRYPWGSGENPYHHGASSPFGRRRSKDSSGERKSLTDKQKRAIKIGAAAAATALAVAGTVYLAKSGKLDSAIDVGRAAASRALENSRNKRIDGEKVREEFKEIRRDRKDALKKRRLLSDKELNDRIKRLEKEKKMKELIREDLYPGRKDVEDVLKATGKKVIGGAAAGGGLLLSEYLIRKQLGDKMTKEELAKATKEYMRPKKK